MTDVLPDIPRLYTAIAEWIACIVYISLLKKKLHGWKLIGFVVLVLFAQATFLITTKDLPIVFWIPSMIVAIAMMFLFIYLSCEITLIEAGYFSVRAFVAAELVASFEWQIHYFLWKDEFENTFMASILLFSIVFVFSFGLIWIFERRLIPKEGKLNIRKREFLSTLTIGVAVFSISNLSFITSRTPFSGQYAQDILNIRTFVDLGGFAILYAYHIQINDLRVRHELQAMQTILRKQYEQYQQSKESIEIINYKYHDLKNQIIALKALKSPEERNKYLTQMEDEIKFYEAQNKTGNHVLDTLFTSKNLYCINNNITLTYVVDGTLLDNMEVMDICTIFGNALDNAIEYEKQIEDEEKRLIHVTLFKQKGFLMMKFENYFEDELYLVGGLPETTKKESHQHGYGLKSIRYTVQKYDGVVNIEKKGNWFEMKILMPLLK
ncbi:sensor histidine kinase [Gracilibacillus saliphilus]|uniref:sensor histidine kinase n=1 Tax=Gracilibacillus saliphilus TaxID=543890 RepID=UPI0013D7A7A7|nr:sensor histidine kinase [Gracilibacillus saliphilus]